VAKSGEDSISLNIFFFPLLSFRFCFRKYFFLFEREIERIFIGIENIIVMRHLKKLMNLPTYPQNEFSIWIFVWYIFYRMGAIPYNPFLFLVIALVCVIFQFIDLVRWTKAKRSYILVLFVAINIVIKVLPIYDLKYHFHGPSNPWAFATVCFGGGLFGIYMILMYINFHATIFDLVHAYSKIAHQNKPNYSIMFWLIQLFKREKKNLKVLVD